MMQRLEGYFYLALFCGSIPLANWLIGNVGTFCAPDGPCVVPVWPGIAAPVVCWQSVQRLSCATSCNGGWG